MGSTTLLDIIGSTMTFGFLLLIVLRLNGSASESSFGYNANYLLQRNMVVLTVMLEDDLKHVGAGVNDGQGGITLANTTDLIFRAQLPGNNFISTVEWKLEPTGPTGVQNTNIRYLSRTVDGVVNMMNLGVTIFSLEYYNIYHANSKITTLPITFTSTPNTGNIGPVSVTLRLESDYRPTAEYLEKKDTSSYLMVWRQIRSVSRNNSVQFQ